MTWAVDSDLGVPCVQGIASPGMVLSGHHALRIVCYRTECQAGSYEEKSPDWQPRPDWRCDPR